jgi:hypothetical protein
MPLKEPSFRIPTSGSPSYVNLSGFLVNSRRLLETDIVPETQTDTFRLCPSQSFHNRRTVRLRILKYHSRRGNQ